MLAYFGGSESDNVRGLAVDAAGRVHVAGLTLSRDFPLVQPLAGQQTAPGAANAFVATVAADGSALAFSTYLGGSEADEAHGIAVSPDGALSWSVRPAVHRLSGTQRPPGGRCPGTRWLRHENRRGPDAGLVDVPRRPGQRQPVRDRCRSDAAPSAVVGTSNSHDYPSQQPRRCAGGGFDATVSRFSPPGPLFSTVLGGGGHDAAQAVAVDASGVIHVGGSTTSADFPAANSRPASGDGLDAFAVTYASGRRHARRAWRIGGSGPDRARAIAVDGTGLYLAGQTASANFPVQRAVAGRRRRQWRRVRGDVAGPSIVYATYLGTSGTDDATGLAVDGVGRVVADGHGPGHGLGQSWADRRLPVPPVEW